MTDRVPLQLAMLTCDRRRRNPNAQATVNDSLRSLHERDPCAGSVPMRLVVDGTDADFVDHRLAERLAIELLGDAFDAAASELATLDRLSRAYQLLLEGADPGRCLLSFEDDVTFAPLWLERTLAASLAIEEHHGRRYVLALFCPFPYVFDPSSLVEGFFDTTHDRQHELPPPKPYAPYDVPRFYGMQGIFMPPAVHQDLRGYMAYRYGTGQPEPVDIMLRRFLATTGTPLFAVNPNVVDHVGQTSTWSDPDRPELRSPSFRAHFEPTETP